MTRFTSLLLAAAAVVGFAAFADAFQALKTPSTQCKVLLVPD